MAGRRVCVLLSGGLDSALLVAHYLRRGDRVVPLYVSAGLRWESVERYWARRFLKALSSTRIEPLERLELDYRDLVGGTHWSFRGRVPSARARWDSVYLPGRNLLLLSKAGVLASRLGVDRVALASVAGNPFDDARPEFFRAMSAALSKGLGRRLTVEAPFRATPKPRLLKRFLGLPLHLTFSCLRPVGRLHCGRCTKCFERRQAFRKAGVADPTRYA